MIFHYYSESCYFMSDAGQGEKKGVGWIVLSYLNVGFLSLY